MDLHKVVEQNISRKEEKKRTRELEREKNSQILFMFCFREYLDKLLKEEKNFKGWIIKDIGNFDYFYKIAEQLGFIVKPVYVNGIIIGYMLNVPDNCNGKAQIALQEFKDKFVKINKKREFMLLVKCQDAKERLENGWYSYKILSEEVIQIDLKSDIMLYDANDYKIVADFFDELKFKFMGNPVDGHISLQLIR